MLVQINTEAGGVTTDEKGRFFNFMASLHAVATAAAGSTPTVNPVVTSTGLKNSSFNCITVLSSAEAGGWTAANSNNITAATAYNASIGTPHTVDLFNFTGKTTYPYYRMTFSNSQYAFNSSFDSYPWLNQWCGHTNLDPATTAYTSDTNYSNSTWSSGRNPSSTSYYNQTSYPYMMHIIVSKTAQPVYVAVTATYMIITTPYDIFYFGQRTVAPWELTRADNPPWVSFGWSGAQANFPNAAPNNNPYCSHYQAWTSTVSPEGSYITTPTKMGSSRQSYTYNQAPNTLCGVINSNSVTWASNYSYFDRLQPATHPLMTLYSGWNPSYNTPLDGVLTDSATGQTVPAAYPLFFRAVTNVSTGNANTGIQSAIGVFQGILRGPSTTNLGYASMMTSSEYQIGSSTYIPIRVSNGNVDSQDCFWIRKA
jgi:hypothetical protein